MKIKPLFWIVIMVLLSGCRLIPNKSDVLPTLTAMSCVNSNTLEQESTSTIQMTEGGINTPQFKVTATEAQTSSADFSITPWLTSMVTKTPFSTKIPTVALTPYPYRLQANSPVYIQNFAHPEIGCNWLGVAGQVFDGIGKPVNNQVVVVKGQLADHQINSVTLTGLDSAAVYGPGGYEVVLNNAAFSSQRMIFIQLYDLEGHPQTTPFLVDTFYDCSKNLIIVNFEAIK